MPCHDGQDGRVTTLFSGIEGFVQMTERLGDPKMREEYMARTLIAAQTSAPAFPTS